MRAGVKDETDIRDDTAGRPFGVAGSCGVADRDDGVVGSCGVADREAGRPGVPVRDTLEMLLDVLRGVDGTMGATVQPKRAATIAASDGSTRDPSKPGAVDTLSCCSG